MPDLHILIIDDRVFHAVTNDCIPDSFSFFLILELGGMASNEDNCAVFLILLFHFSEFRECVDTIDTAVGPKIYHDDLSPEIVLET